MSEKKNYYEISEEGGLWTATTLLGKKPIIRFQKSVQKLEQHDCCLIAKQINGGYNLYLPVISADGHWIIVNKEMFLVLDNIESYQYYNGIFLLRMKDYCTFIQPERFAQCMTEEILEERKKNLPKIYCKKSYFRTGFEYLSHFLHPMFIFHADDNDYLLETLGGNIFRTDALVKIIPTGGIAEPLPLSNRLVKIVTDKGIFLCDENGVDKENCYHSIEPFESMDYTEIYPMEEGYTGFWFKDSDGNILRMSIGRKNSSWIKFNITPKYPAESIVNVKNYIKDEEKLQIWKITYINGEKEFILICRGEFFDINPEIFLN